MLFTMRSKDNAWANELTRRIEQLRDQRLAARLRVSEEAFWWYIQEFGSASHAERGSTGTAPRDADGWYQITARYSSELVFDGENGLIRTKSVFNPGTPAKHFVGSAIDEIRKEFATQLAPLVATGQMNLAREMLLNEVMQRALRLIVDNIAQQLQGHHTFGRLEDQTAADNFEQNAELVDVSG